MGNMGGGLIPLLSLQPLSFILLLLILFLYITLTDFRRVKKLAGYRPIPDGSGLGLGSGPETYPLIGCLKSFYKNRFRLLDWYTELLAESPTNTIVVCRLGARRTIVTANPQNVEHILKTNFHNFPKGKPFTDILGDFLGCGIFNADGDSWLAQRKLASHVFTARSVRQFVTTTLEAEVRENLLPAMEALAEEERVVDLQELLGRFSFSVICRFTLGSDVCCCLDPSSPISPLARAFDVAAEVSARRGAAPLFLVWKVKRWLGVGSERRLREAVEEVQKLVMKMIQERKVVKKMYVTGGDDDDDDDDEDLLSRLISAGHEEEVIRDMLISFIMAGRDTTSAAMTWFFWLLSRYPDTENDLVKEITKVKPKETTTLNYESLKELTFLKASLNECMRLYPPVAWDSKHATCDDMLPDGTKVLAGDRVTYFPYGMGRMEALWGKDWFEFRPDRWFVEEGLEKSEGGRLIMREVCPFKFPIFQAGPRVCLGKEMAFVQMKYVVASILQRFKISVVSPEKPVFVPLLTAHMAGGLKVLLSKRE